jgi:hypothetical protein
VVERAADDRSAYRSSANPVVAAMPGTVADVRTALDEAAATRSAFALAVVSLGTAPLIVACVLGFAP